MKQILIFIFVSMMAAVTAVQMAAADKASSDEEKKDALAALLNPVEEVEEFYTPDDIMFRDLANSFVECAPDSAKEYVQNLVNAGFSTLEDLRPYTPIETKELTWTIDGKEYPCHFKRYDFAPESGHRYFDLYYVNDYNFKTYMVDNGVDKITGEVCPGAQSLHCFKWTCENFILCQTDRGFYMYTPNPNYIWGGLKSNVYSYNLSMPDYSHALWNKYASDAKARKDGFVAYGNTILECVDDDGKSFKLRNGKFIYDIAKDDSGFKVSKYYRHIEKDGNEEKKFDIRFHVNDTIKDVIQNGKVLTFLMNENDTVKFSTHSGWVFEYSIHRPDFIARKRHKDPSTITFLKDASIWPDNIGRKRVPVEAGSVLTNMSKDVDPRYETRNLTEHLIYDDRYINNISEYINSGLLSRSDVKIADPTGEEVFYTYLDKWMCKYANEYKAREEARQKEEEARQAQEVAAKKKPIYDAYCAKYGKKYIDAALEGSILVGAPIAMIKELFECGLYADNGAYKSYEVITDTLEYDFDNKKIVRHKVYVYPAKLLIHTKNGRVTSKIVL